MAARTGWSRYGDINYVDHVMRYYSPENGTVVVSGNGTQSFDVEEVHSIMKQYLELPYVWGGRTPAAGGFDCSGLLEYAFAQVGIDLYGTAQSQYNKTRPVPEDQIKPGDLVFSSTYKPGASHVGMYVGDGQFINANGGGGTSYSCGRGYILSWALGGFETRGLFMEPTQKKNFVFLMMGFAAAAVVIMYVFILRTQLQEVRANQRNYEEQIKELSSIDNTEALKVNREFLEQFFNYETTAERYENIKPFMTEQGYKATHPSGTELPNPNSEESVKSSNGVLKAFNIGRQKRKRSFLMSLS
jgi:hypothetical protein